MSNYRNIDLDGLAQVFRALSNRHRLQLYLTLVSCCRPGTTYEVSQRACVGELGSELGIAASTVSHHLRELRQAGLIHMTRKGQNVECWVEPDSLDGLSAFFGGTGRDGSPPDQWLRLHGKT